MESNNRGGATEHQSSTKHRGNVDDLGMLVGLELGQKRARGPKATEKINANGSLNVGIGELEQRSGGDDACVVDEDCDFAEC